MMDDDTLAEIAALKSVVMMSLVVQSTLVAGPDPEAQRAFLDEMRDNVLRFATATPVNIEPQRASRIAEKVQATVRAMFDNTSVHGTSSGTA